MARWLDPTVAEWTVTRVEEAPPPPPPPDQRAQSLWPEICEQFALRILASTYQMGSHLEVVEADEQDPDRLGRLYRIDHANTRMRRHAENLQVLLGRRVEDAESQLVPLLDVVRAATSAIEYYSRVQVGHVVDLAVVEFAADDVIRVLTELLDNATRFSPPASSVIVSGYITEEGSVLLRIEDAGLGVRPALLPALNAMLAGNAPAPSAANPAAHLGLLVVAHLALANQLRVRLVNRPSGGTTATVLVPNALLCEVAPGATTASSAEPPRPGPPAQPPPTWDGTYRGDAPVAAPNLTPTNGQSTPVGGAGAGRSGAAGGGLPRRQRESVRGDGGSAGAHHLRQSAPQPRSAPTPGPDRDTWPDETADFAAGISDARPSTTHDEPEGRP